MAAILLVHSFSQIIMWAESDATFHGTVIKQIHHGVRVPISLVPRDNSIESYYFAYPKAFHFFSAFFTRLLGFDLLNSIKTIPLVIQIIIPFGIYVFLRQIQPQRELALFASALTFLQFNHIFPLIFGLYPSMTSLVLVIAILVVIMVDHSNAKIPIIVTLLITIVFVHQRFLVHALLVGGWALLWRYREVDGAHFLKYFLTSLGSLGIIFIMIGRVHLPQAPRYLSVYMTKFVSLFIPEWYLGFLALPALLLLLTRQNKDDWLIFGWFMLWFSLVLLNDVGTFGLGLTGVRRYQELYLPISVLAGYALHSILSSSKNKKLMTYLIFLSCFVTFPLLFGSIFMTYVPAWTLSLEDYNAMKSLENETGIAVNLDPTGKWIYPIAGMKVTNPRSMPQLVETPILENIIDNPSSKNSLKTLQGLEEEHGTVYIFISQRGYNSPGYHLFGNFYPKINMNEFIESEEFEIFYEEKGSVVLSFVGGR
jgi:hypothetical protein